MRVVAGSAERRAITSLALLSAAFGFLAIGVLTPVPLAQTAPATAVFVVTAFFRPRVVRFDILLAVMVGIILFVPIKRYTLPTGLPFDLEPYRIYVAIVLAAWVASLLVDKRVRIRRSGFEGPIALMCVSVLASELVNPGRVASLGQIVVKAVTFFVSFLLVYYLIVSIVRTRERLRPLLVVLVAGGAVVALTAIYETRTGSNVFNHLGRLLPGLVYHDPGEELRGGNIRAYASAQHPIALSVALLMILPIGIYLAKTSERWRQWWWVAVGLLGIGALATGSRTGAIGLLAIAGVYLWLRPKELRRFWPALVPAVIVVHFALPGAIGGLRAQFFPQGGLIAQQSTIAHGDAEVQQLSNNRLADIGPSLDELGQYNPLFGEGFGTRVTGFDSTFINASILDDQWLKTLLETGIVGMFAWLWWFMRARRRLGREAKRDRSPEGWLAVGLAASIAAGAVCMFTFDMFSFIQVTFLLFIVLAFASVALSTAPADEPAK
jgi:hypothetical protein